MKRSSQGSWRRVWLGLVAVSASFLVSVTAAGSFSLGEPCLNCDASASVDGRFALSSSLIASETSNLLVGGGFSLEGALVPWSYLQHLLSGRVAYYTGNSTVPGVKVVDDAYPESHTITGSDGTFAFAVLNDTEHWLTPSKASDDPVARGVSTLDITLLRRHILGLGALDSTYKMLAGDVNGSGTITTLDITLIRRVVLGLAPSYPAGLWRFVPAGYVFPDPNVPFGADRSLYSDGGVVDRLGQDFIGIKLGDVNGSWTPPVATSSPPPPVANRAAHEIVPVGLSSDGNPDTVASLAPMIWLGTPQDLGGADFVVPLNIGSVRALTSFQCTLQWNPSVFEWVGVDQTSLRGFGEDNLNVQRAKQGELVVSWDDPEGGLNASNNTHSLNLRFRRVPRMPCGGVIRFVAAPAFVEVTSGFVAVPARCQDGWIQFGRTRDASALVLPRVTGDSVELQVPTWVGLTSLVEVSETLVPAQWRWVDSIEGDGTVRRVVLRSSLQGQGYYRVRCVSGGF